MTIKPGTHVSPILTVDGVKLRYIVSQKPKPKYSNSMYTVVAIVEAKSAREAIRIAQQTHEEFSNHPDFNKPVAEPLDTTRVYRF